MTEYQESMINKSLYLSAKANSLRFTAKVYFRINRKIDARIVEQYTELLRKADVLAGCARRAEG